MDVKYCTIITSNYFHYAVTLYESIAMFEQSIQFHILVVDQKGSFRRLTDRFPDIRIYDRAVVCSSGVGQDIERKYYPDDMDCLRWSLKPVFMSYLIDQGASQVFFLDPDLFFLSSPRILSEELDGSAVLLTPHWRSRYPTLDPENFSVLTTSGLFNAGFCGSTSAGLPALQWWASVCAFECVKAPTRGLFNDQAYLDLMPIYFEGVKILRHRGCNVAAWNRLECPRSLGADGKVVIGDNWKVVFIHFTASTISGIEGGHDSLLAEILDEYLKRLGENRCWIPEHMLHGEATNNASGKVVKVFRRLMRAVKACVCKGLGCA